MGKEIRITRTFDAPKDLVWRAWTDPELLVQWWGPRGFTSPVCKIDLKVGGTYLYCMRSEDGQDFWSGGVFKEIVPMKKIVCTDYFADKDGNKLTPQTYGMDENFPEEMDIVVTFEEQMGKTTLTIVYPIPDDFKIREALLKSGMEAGWNESLDKIEEVITKYQST